MRLKNRKRMRTRKRRIEKHKKEVNELIEQRIAHAYIDMLIATLKYIP